MAAPKRPLFKNECSNLFVIVSFLLMIGQVNTNEDDDTEELQGDDVEDKVGLTKHILKKNKIELAAQSKVATKEDLEKYKERFADKANNPCEIDLDEHGNMFLSSRCTTVLRN
ncbi:hypothetical protein Mgra_00004919 [Meloidogyne graminicola]|uniref:Uncharacterized protein n=1 Tax=Meloidogyne graminicola TaxID=189291 RepID=A0A8S9ZRI9_9BILA|nr:hypothetical protein Mgra_00004919 [Meloidogyne graminicola]